MKERQFEIGEKVRVTYQKWNSEAGDIITLEKPCPDRDSSNPCWFSTTNDYWFESEKKGRNLIELDYQEFPDRRVKILAVQNLLSIGQISEKYGDRVRCLYAGTTSPYPPCIALSCLNKIITNSTLDILIPSIISRERFNRLIAYMKAAGERLSRLIREERETKQPSIKTIVI
jgi:hypothetical protein